MSLSVESALESFDFLEQDAADEAESTPRSTASGGSGCHDTGYNSTDDYNKDCAGEGSADASYIVDFMMSNHTGPPSSGNRVNGMEEGLSQNGELKRGENADMNSIYDSPSCISDIFSSPSLATPVQKSDSLDETKAACLPSNASSPRKRIEGGTEMLEESPHHSSYKTRSSRATSPNLSSSYGSEVTVGNKILDKVRCILKLFQ